jgi:hypothetical protein
VIDTIVDIRPVLRAFDRVSKTDGRKVFSASRKPLRSDLREHAKDQSGPSGRWPGLAASTIERRARGPRRRRKLLGRLPAAVRVTTGSDFIRAEWMPKFSRLQKEGGRGGKNARIPGRDFAWLSKKVVRAVRDLFVAALDRAWAGR